MAARRLTRGTRVEPVSTPWVIEKASKEKLTRLASQAGYSASVFLELVIDHVEDELTDRGVPHWLPQPELKDGELPISAD